MKRCRFVEPEVVRLSLSDGEWIEVKKELNAGESRRVFSRLVKTMHFNEKAEVDPEQVGLSKVVAYLVDWSLTDAAGKSVKADEAALNSLDSETYNEIVKLIEAHDEAVEKAITERKNAKGDTSGSSAILSSVA